MKITKLLPWFKRQEEVKEIIKFTGVIQSPPTFTVFVEGAVVGTYTPDTKEFIPYTRTNIWQEYPGPVKIVKYKEMIDKLAAIEFVS